MPLHNPFDGILDVLVGNLPGNPQKEALVKVSLSSRNTPVQALNRRKLKDLLNRLLVVDRGVDLLYTASKVRNGLAAQDVLDSDSESALLSKGHELDSRDGVSAKIEEGVVESNLAGRQVEDARPELTEDGLGLSGRLRGSRVVGFGSLCGVGSAGVGRLGELVNPLRDALPVELSRREEGERSYNGPHSRDHVGGELLPKAVADLYPLAQLPYQNSIRLTSATTPSASIFFSPSTISSTSPTCLSKLTTATNLLAAYPTLGSTTRACLISASTFK